MGTFQSETIVSGIGEVVCINPDVANEINDKSTMSKIMEYIALGKPVIQFDLTEGHFSAGHSFFYADKNNAQDAAEIILEVLDQPELAREMGEYGRQRMEKDLAREYEAPRLLAAYNLLFGS